MKKINSYILLLLCFSTVSYGQKVGVKAILDKGSASTAWNSKSYGLSYEKRLSEKRLLTLETGLYLNFKNNKKQEDYSKGYTKSAFFISPSETVPVLKNYNEIEKIREIHIPIVFKKYFHIGKSIFFMSWGPKLAITLADKIHYKESLSSILTKEDLFKDSGNSRFYLYNKCTYNIGFESKKIQFSIAPLPGMLSGAAEDWRDNAYLFSFSLGYMF